MDDLRYDLMNVGGLSLSSHQNFQNLLLRVSTWALSLSLCLVGCQSAQKAGHEYRDHLAMP